MRQYPQNPAGTNRRSIWFAICWSAWLSCPVTEIYNPPPLLFYRGDKSRLQQAQIAIVVGSRNPPTCTKITFDMAQYLAQAGYIITSGLAMGVDKRAHLVLWRRQMLTIKGRTVGVMGTGIDVNYPIHRDQLFAKLLSKAAASLASYCRILSHNKHTFPRRNRLVAGWAWRRLWQKLRCKVARWLPHA